MEKLLELVSLVKKNILKRFRAFDEEASNCDFHNNMQ